MDWNDDVDVFPDESQDWDSEQRSFPPYQSTRAVCEDTIWNSLNHQKRAR